MTDSLTLILKGTRLCNLRCAYCHDWRVGTNQTMSFKILARTIAAALASDSAHVHFIWHGGETTILPVSFYEKALSIQSRFRRPGQRIVNSIQTNGTLVDGEWASFFSRNAFGVGVSIDGTATLHNRQRPYAGGRGSWEDTLRGIRILEEHGVRTSVLMVIDDDALAMGAQRVFDSMLSNGIKRFGLLSARPVNQPDAVPGTATKHYVTATRMSQFLMAMYECWERHGDPEIQVRELAAVRSQLTAGAEKPCTLMGGCIGTFFLVEPDGEIAHCDLFLGDRRFTLGNIIETDFASLRQSAATRNLVRANKAELLAVSQCPEVGICNGGCPHDRYLTARHDPANAGCCGQRELIQFVRERLVAAGVNQQR